MLQILQLQSWKKDIPVICNTIYHKTILATFIIERIPIGLISGISIDELAITIQAHEGVFSMKSNTIYLFDIINDVIKDSICVFHR